MLLKGREIRDRDILQWMLLGFAFFLPLSIAIAEPLAFAAMPVWVYGLWRDKEFRSVLRCPYFWPAVLFAVCAIVCSLFGVRPSSSVLRFHRLLLLAIPFMIWRAFGGGGEREGVLATVEKAGLFYVLGACLLAIQDLVRVPLEMSRGVQLYDTGNMRDPQLYLVAVSLLLALWLTRRKRGWRWLGAMLLVASGLVLHFKRGVWVAFLCGVAIMGATARKWRIVALIALCAVALLFVPQVRQRLDLLRGEWSVRQGGRYVLWTKVAPELLREHPWGMGFGAVTHADLAARARYVQPKLDHLHNNVLQVALEVGWLGLGIWLVWMTVTGVMLHRAYRVGEREGSPTRWVALGAFTAFCGLMLNGMVEYNFGDSEILMVLCYLMGLSCALWERQKETPPPTSTVPLGP